jgi:hypothetical protein
MELGSVDGPTPWNLRMVVTRDASNRVSALVKKQSAGKCGFVYRANRKQTFEVDGCAKVQYQETLPVRVI